MGRFIGYEECPKCVEQGRDRAGDNLGVYDDGGGHCFSCGFHRFPTHYIHKQLKEEHGNKAVLPSDFQREVPAAGWKWLLPYGLPYSYWKDYTGYSPTYDRLIFTYGNPIRFSIGRALKPEERKWRIWGDKLSHVEIFNEQIGGEIVVVEDLISAHKVSQVASCICLFGTILHDPAIKILMVTKRPVVLWLDDDQYTLLPKKINRLQSLLDVSVRYVKTQQDPKYQTIEQIKGVLK